MYCPKCGGESLEAQKFCKACGTNLQLINDALSGGEGPHPFGIDVDALAKNAREFARSFKTNVGVVAGGRTSAADARERYRVSREVRRQAREEARRQNVPKPKEYMSYSWQHNLRNGLVSLFWGAGLGVVLFYLGQTAIDDGLIGRLVEWSQGHVQGVEPLVRIIWLIALLPALKGLAHIIYAAFFAESMATLTTRFTPPPLALEEPRPFLRQDTAPVVERETAPKNYEPSFEPPPSVTEHTTHIFDESQPQMKRETQ
jgi:hypothetical protein